jgi:hypothetical protein
MAMDEGLRKIEEGTENERLEILGNLLYMCVIPLLTSVSVSLVIFGKDPVPGMSANDPFLHPTGPLSFSSAYAN